METSYPDSLDSTEVQKIDIIVTLSGRAATETMFGTLDAGASSDLQNAFGTARRLYGTLCYGGFSTYMDHRTSNEQDRHTEIAVIASVENFYLKAKEILCKNRDFLEKVAMALAEKDVLLASDIAAIRNESTIAAVVI